MRGISTFPIARRVISIFLADGSRRNRIFMKLPSLLKGWLRKNGASITSPPISPNRETLALKVTYFFVLFKIFNTMVNSVVVMVTLLMFGVSPGSFFGKNTRLVAAFKSLNLEIPLVLNIGRWSRAKIGRAKTPKIPNKSVNRKIMRTIKLSAPIQGRWPMFW